MGEKRRDPSGPVPDESFTDPKLDLSAAAGPEEGTTLTLQSASQDFEQIGAYRILRKVGEGGMGVVYEAEQERPIRRKVALKQIKLGMDTREVVARFESERQALALMNHPCIAKVFDAGATQEGRPFFVMEYVQGVPLTQYCDSQRLSMEERLRLFMLVCEGVQHAHQKGVIHRDLKPSNVLVGLQDGVPVPKIIDFGVAKAITQRLTEKTLYTGFGQAIGTPAYMSPEQAQMTGLDIDTRTDVYSLGVMLYELLVGALPFSASEMRQQGFEEIRRAVLEQEPRRPSAQVSGMAAEASRVTATCRRTDPRSLMRQLRGDLDWIVLKALEKDRTRRYASASELSADIARHLQHEPVLAGQPSAAYRVRKFVRRHRMGVAAAALVVAVLLAGIVGTTLSMLRAKRAEARARMEADTAKRVQDFLVDLFKVSDPGEARGKTVTAREILDRGAVAVEKQLEKEPLIQARMMDTMGVVYKNLGLRDPAQKLIERATDLLRSRLGANDPDLATALSHLGGVRSMQGRLDECTALQEEALSIREKALGPTHVDTGWSYYALGGCFMWTGQYERARHNIRHAQRIFETALGREHYSVAWCLNDLAVIDDELKEYEAAQALYQRALEIKEKNFGPDHPDVAIGLNSVGWVLLEQGQFAKAEPILRRALSIATKSLEPGHPFVIESSHSLGELMRQMGRLDEAKDIFQRTLTIAEKAGLRQSKQGAEVLQGLARIAQESGDTAEAESLYRQSLSVFEAVLGPDNALVAGCLNDLADLCRESGRSAEAEQLKARAEAIRAQNTQKPVK